MTIGFIVFENIDKTDKDDQCDDKKTDQISHHKCRIILQKHHESHGIDSNNHRMEETIEHELNRISGIWSYPK
jgi:hypothetical protein